MKTHIKYVSTHFMLGFSCLLKINQTRGFGSYHPEKTYNDLSVSQIRNVSLSDIYDL